MITWVTHCSRCFHVKQLGEACPNCDDKGFPLPPKDKAVIDASLARTDYITDHYKRRLMEDVNKLNGEIVGAIWFTRGFAVGMFVTLVIWLLVYTQL